MIGDHVAFWFPPGEERGPAARPLARPQIQDRLGLGSDPRGTPVKLETRFTEPVPK